MDTQLTTIHPHLRYIQFYYIHNSKHMRSLLIRISHVHVHSIRLLYST